MNKSLKRITGLIIMLTFACCLMAQKSVTRLPNDSTYKNRSGKTMWVITNAALDTFTVNLIRNRTCQRINDSLHVQVALEKTKNQFCDSSLKIRSAEALMWHNKLDSSDLKLQRTEINLLKEQKSKAKWVKATFGSAGAALVFLITTIIFAAR